MKSMIRLPITPLDRGSIRCISFLEDESTLIIGDGAGAVHFYDTETARERRPRWVPQTKAAVMALRVAKEKRLIAYGTFKYLYLLNCNNLKITTSILPVVSGRQQSAYVAASSPDGSILATTDYSGIITLWDVDTRKKLGILAGPKIPPRGSRSPDHPLAKPAMIGYLDFTPAGTGLVASSLDGVRIWDHGRGRLRLKIDFDDQPSGISISPDGKVLTVALIPRAVEGEDYISIRDLATGEEQLAIRGVYEVGFLPNGTGLVSLGPDQTIRLWDVANWHQISMLRYDAEDESCSRLAIDPTGKRIETAGMAEISFIDIEGTTLRPYQPSR